MTRMSHLLAGVAMTPMEQAAGRYMRAPDHPVDDGGFADAFKAAAAADEPPAETPPAETPPAETPPAETPPAETPPAKGAETPPAETPPAETPPAKGAETPPAETPPAETPPAKGAETPPAETPPAAPSAEDIVKGLAEALKAQPPAAPAKGAETPPAEQQEQPPLYSPEETEVLTEYEKNWPDVAKAEALKRRAEYHDLMAFMFKSVHDYLAPHLAQLGAVGNVMHEQQLRVAVPDYTPDLETQVASWIETQPAYLQAGMKQVMQSGTSDEVADLIGRYRAATGAQPAPAPTPTPTPAPAEALKTELSSAAKQAAESLAPVSGDRSAVPQGEDPGDFKTAFQKFAAEADAT